MLSHLVQRKASNIKLSDRHHSVIKESSCLMLYRPIIQKSIAQLIRMVIVTGNKNRPFSYRFTQVNQRNLWTMLDWTSQIPLKVTFSSENNL